MYCHERVVDVVDMIKHMPNSETFHAPLDWRGEGLLDYPSKISHPMDLGTILAQSAYCDASKIRERLLRVFKNAMRYNKRGSAVYKLAKNFLKECERLLRRYVDDDYSSISKDEKCEYMDFLKVVRGLDESCEFWYPINFGAYPDYLDKVEKAMDFSTIEKKLVRDEYESVSSINDDIRLIFSNCRAYNDSVLDVVRACEELECFVSPMLLYGKMRYIFLPTSSMKLHLYNDIRDLSNSSRLELVDLVRKTETSHVKESLDSCVLSIDDWSLGLFLRVRVFVYRNK